MQILVGGARKAAVYGLRITALLRDWLVEGALQLKRLQLVIVIEIKGDPRGHRLHRLRINMPDRSDNRRVFSRGQYGISVIIQVRQDVRFRRSLRQLLVQHILDGFQLRIARPDLRLMRTSRRPNRRCPQYQCAQFRESFHALPDGKGSGDSHGLLN